MKDAVATMGGVLPNDAGGRDAVHVAVISSVSPKTLRPGQDVELSEVRVQGPEGRDECRALPSYDSEKAIGIVDPFIRGEIAPGQRFWLFLYPRTITGLNHQWSHPAFPDGNAAGVYVPPSSKLESEQWLKKFAEDSGSPRYALLIEALNKLADSGGESIHFDGEQYDDDYYGAFMTEDYLHFGGVDAYGDIPEEFWKHAEIITGKKFKFKPTYFSCGC